MGTWTTGKGQTRRLEGKQRDRRTGKILEGDPSVGTGVEVNGGSSFA